MGEGLYGKYLHLLNVVANLKLLYKKIKSFENCEDISIYGSIVHSDKKVEFK